MGWRTAYEKRICRLLVHRKASMPVTEFQRKIAKLLSVNRHSQSYLAGGAALHFEPNSIRFSQDLDYFHDSEIKVAEAFTADADLLKSAGIDFIIEMHQPGYIRVIAKSGKVATKIEWAHDSSWRFLPTVVSEDVGFVLQPIDLAINKILALAGRDEPRDYLDVLHAHRHILSIPGMVWAACGKDPGFTPDSLLALLRRKGKYRLEDFRRLHLNVEIDLIEMKNTWIAALTEATSVCRKLPPDELGCLYYHRTLKKFVTPTESKDLDVVPHYATEGGVVPKISDVSDS